MTRREMEALAARIVRISGSAMAPADAQVVVLVTDANGEWMAVDSNVGVDRTTAICDAAAAGPEDWIVDEPVATPVALEADHG